MNKIISLFLALLTIITGALYFAIDTYQKKYARLDTYGGPTHIVEPFTLLNQDSVHFDSEEHRDKIWVVNSFFASCPSICPKMMRNMQEVHFTTFDEEDVLLLSLTVDPKRDTPNRLSRHSDIYKSDRQQWQMLTGEKKELYKHIRKSFLIAAAADDEELDFIHSENIIVLDKNQKVRAIINGIDENADKKILNAINKLKRQS